MISLTLCALSAFLSPKQSTPVDTNKQGTEQLNDEDELPADLLEEIFNLNAELIKSTKVDLSTEQKLSIYGLYKQATIGDCNKPKPFLFLFKESSMWNAWNILKGKSNNAAMKGYIYQVASIDKTIKSKVESVLKGEELNHEPQAQETKVNKQYAGFKMVEQEDYSDSYSHPYFKLIQKGLPIDEVTKEMLLECNNSPKVYPLHFAIDKERADLVEQFLKLLNCNQIRQMEDEDGTGILEYAQLIENSEILKKIELKLMDQS